MADLQNPARTSGALPGSDFVFGDMAWASAVVLRFRFCSIAAATRDGLSYAVVSMGLEERVAQGTHDEGIHVFLY